MPVPMTAQQLEEARQRWAAEKERRAKAARDGPLSGVKRIQTKPLSVL
jgi:hypothetical protein